MKLIIALAAVALAWTSVTGPARAQDASPGALAAAREITDLLMKTGYQAALVDPSWAPVEAAIRRSKPDATPAQLAGVKAVFEQILTEESAPSMAQIPTLYARHFTEGELRDMLAFYRTPTGQKALATLPQVSAETMQMVMGNLTQSMPRMQQRLQQALIDNGLGAVR
ncbi:MAG: DUF2059 domain-containing protein [Hansschlegelia sp.]